METLPFVTFFVASLLTALLAGTLPAILVAVASFLASWYFFLAPAGSFALIWPSTYIALGFYALVVGTEILAIHLLFRLAARLRAESASVGRLLEEERLLRGELRVRTAEGMRFIGEMLSLQAKADPGCRAALLKAAQRVTQVAEIHGLLHAEPRMRDGLAEFLGGIARRRLAVAGQSAIALEVIATGPHPGLERLAAIGLIVAEAVGNVARHAFLPGSPGRLMVRMAQRGDGQMELRVTDDGAGLAPRPADGLGLTLMRGMAARLRGDLALTLAPSGRGTEMRVVFPPPAPGE